MPSSIILRVYSITVLLIISSAANASNAFTKPRTYSTNKCFRLGILQIIPRCSLGECATQCVLWKKCVGISYNRQMTACFLIDDHFNMENATVNDTVCINMDIKDILLPRRSSEGACSRQPCSENEECLVKGKGEGNFECIPKVCPELLETKNATIPYGSRLVGSTKSIRCHEGYTMFGNSSITCEKDGYWSTSDFQCYKNCPTPRLSNAVVTSFNPRLAYNTTAKFICNDGYTALGDLKVTCLSNGQWSDPEFECYPNCPTPSIPNADMITSATTLAFNTTVTMKCREGYYNKATESNLFTITCGAAGQWSNAKPCLVYSSNSPTSYTNGPGLTTPDKMITTINYATATGPTSPDKTTVSSNSPTTIGYTTEPGPTATDETITTVTVSSNSQTTIRYPTAPGPTATDETITTMSLKSSTTIRYPTTSGPTSPDETITAGSSYSPTNIRYPTAPGPTSPDKTITTMGSNSPTSTKYTTEPGPTPPDKTVSSNSPTTVRYIEPGPTSSDKTITTVSSNSPTSTRYATALGPTSPDTTITTESSNSICSFGYLWNEDKGKCCMFLIGAFVC